MAKNWRALAAHPELVGHPDWAKELAEAGQYDKLLALNDGLINCVDVVKILLKRAVEIRTALAENPSLLKNPVLAQKLARDKSPTIVRAIARRADVTGDLATILTKDSRSEIRSALASNPAISRFNGQVRLLANDDDLDVRRHLARNPAIVRFSDIVKEFLSSDDVGLRLALGANLEIGKMRSVVRQLAADESVVVRATLAKNSALSEFPKLVEKLSRDVEKVRSALAQNLAALSTLPVSESNFLKEDVAAREFIALRARAKNPPGSFDSARRWYPDQYFSCCSNVRSPSRAWPFSELTHARTARHVAARFGVDESAVRKRARQLDKS